jgi:hypothetical protein
MPINKVTTSGSSGDAIGTITPQNSGDALLVGISPWQSSGSTPGWTHIDSGAYYQLPGSTSPATLDVPTPLAPYSEWAMMMLDIPTTGSAAYVGSGNIDFGTYPLSTYTHTFTASAGDALIVQLASDSLGIYDLSITDTQGNEWQIYQYAVKIGTYYRGVLFAVAYGVAAGSVTATININGIIPASNQTVAINWQQFSGFIAPPPPIPPLQTVVISFQDPAGNPLANGYVKLRLQQDISAAFTGGPQIAAGRTVTIQLDENGIGVVKLWQTTNLFPTTSFFAEAYTAKGQPCWQGNITVGVGASYILLEDGSLILLETGGPNGILTEVQ